MAAPLIGAADTSALPTSPMPAAISIANKIPRILKSPLLAMPATWRGGRTLSTSRYGCSEAGRLRDRPNIFSADRLPTAAAAPAPMATAPIAAAAPAPMAATAAPAPVTASAAPAPVLYRLARARGVSRIADGRAVDRGSRYAGAAGEPDARG